MTVFLVFKISYSLWQFFLSVSLKYFEKRQMSVYPCRIDAYWNEWRSVSRHLHHGRTTAHSFGSILLTHSATVLESCSVDIARCSAALLISKVSYVQLEKLKSWPNYQNVYFSENYSNILSAVIFAISSFSTAETFLKSTKKKNKTRLHFLKKSTFYLKIFCI